MKNAINGYFSGLFKYKNETISKLNEIFSKVEQLRKEEAGVDKEIAGKVQEVQDASKKLKELFGLVSGRNGVENNLNCSFVRERYGIWGVRVECFYHFCIQKFVQ